ncbi:MAG TPA: hypothetical protein PKY73_14935, partial [Hyphomonas sp.]|nr:hypothetical protein [Hyphomonas sp.]
MSFIQWFHSCIHSVFEVAAFTSAGFIHAVLHVVVYGTPVVLLTFLVWVAILLPRRMNARRVRLQRPEEDLRRAHAVGLANGIFRLIFHRPRLRQAALLLIAAAAMPTLYLTLEIPKHIINHAIGSESGVIRIGELTFSQLEFLVSLCFLYLVCLLANGAIKYWLSVYQGRVAETLIRRLRLVV